MDERIRKWLCDIVQSIDELEGFIGDIDCHN
jgi:hypothetical protein